MAEQKRTVRALSRTSVRDDDEKGMPRLDMETCISCSACEIICPTKAISLVEVNAAKGRKGMPQIRLDLCIFCGLCEEACPTECLAFTKKLDLEVYDRRVLVKRPEELQG